MNSPPSAEKKGVRWICFACLPVGMGFWILILGFTAGAMVDVAEIGVGARLLGMGKASAGGMDDASAIFTNPAGLTQNPNLNILSMSGTILTDVNYLLVGAANASPLGQVGIGYLNASVGSIPITEITGSGSTAAVVQTGSTDYSSSIIFFSYASKLSRLLQGKADNVSIGGSLKYFLQGFSGGGTTMQDALGTGMDADLGIMWQANQWVNLGVTFSNFLPENFGGRFVWQKNSVTESIPMAIRLGGGFRILGESALRYDENQALNLLIDYESKRESNRPAVWHTGLEYWPLGDLALRAGIDQKPKAAEAGIGIDNNLTAGVGIKYMGFTFDYAYHQFGELAENATHFFSIGYRGPEERIKKPAAEKKRRGGIIPIPEVAPKPALKTFSDIPADFWAGKPIEYLATLGIMGGYPDGTFHPDQPLTRGELAALLVKAKGFKIEKASEKIFKDVQTKDWLAPYVEVAVERKYIKGYTDGTFRPNQEVTRAEAAVVFSKFGGLYVKPKVEEKVFPDVEKGHWASPAIAASKDAGFFEYLAGKGFGADQILTRAETAEILSKTHFVKEKIRKLIFGEE